MIPSATAMPGRKSTRHWPTETRRAPLCFLVLVLAPAVVLGQPPDRQPQSGCRELDEVQYRPPTTVPLQDRVVVTRTRNPLPASGDKHEAKPSPQGTARLVRLEQPDFLKEGPYNTRIAVTGNKARPLGLVLEFRKHTNSAVQVDWLNEKLLFIRVWWGRIVSTDLVLYVETGKLVYAEEADYLNTITPCDGRHHG